MQTNTVTKPDSSLEQELWNDACLAIEIIAKMSERAMPRILVCSANNAVLDIWQHRLKDRLDKFNFRTLPLGIDAQGLLGGLDISTTLSTGIKSEVKGLLKAAEGGVLIVPSSPSPQEDVLNPLIAEIDKNQNLGVLVIDRSSSPEDEACPEALLDRMAIHVDLNLVSYGTAKKPTNNIIHSHAKTSICNDQEITEICNLALGFGLSSMRPSIQAIQVAIANAALNGRDRVIKADIETSIRLSLLNRAKKFPDFSEPEDDYEPESPQADNENKPDENDQDQSELQAIDDIDVDIEHALLSPDILDVLKAKLKTKTKNSALGKRGAKKYNFKRGRPVASVKRKISSRNRLDLISTLRAAVPWQKIRKTDAENKQLVAVRPADFHVKRYRQQSETTTIFVVDASGSTALNRLGEAKGAIEMLLAESYARRDHVALISVKGQQAELLLPPTRSLVRAKRHLTGLRGGGGTPLADGLKLAAQLYDDETKRGRLASIVVLTDGSANIALDGQGGRAQASEDALDVATSIGVSNAPSMIVDVNRLPNKRAEALADAIGGAYIPMPFASSRNISDAVKQNLKS